MFKLQVANPDATGGNLLLTWCADQDLLKKLLDNGITDPQVVIVVAPTTNYDISKEYRKVVPLKDLMTYVELKVAGPNKIWGFVYDTVDLRASRVRDKFLGRNSGQFDTWVLSSDGNGFSPYHDYDSSDPISIEVPKQVFAKEPAQWEKTWVNHWFRDKPQDQCDFRRRRLLAYTVQPVAVALDLLVRSVFLLLSTLWLSRGMTFRYLLHPLSYALGDGWDVMEGGSWAIANLPEDEAGGYPELTLSYVVRKFWKAPLMPVVLCVGWALYHFHMLWAALLVIWIVLIFLGGVLLIASGAITHCVDSLGKWLSSQKEETAPWYLDQEEIDLVTCNPNMAKRTSIKALPRRHRTVKLRFQDLKSKVCRPFSA